MNCEKTIYDAYRVSVNGEHATVCIADWASVEKGRAPRFGGEILVHSSFGSFGNTWTHCAEPFKQFLAGMGFDSFMKKCFGADLMEFDGHASVSEVKAELLRLRRGNELSAQAASEQWEVISQAEEIAESSALAFHLTLSGILGEETALGSAEHFVVQKVSSQARGFWDELWPHIKSQLEAELNQDINKSALRA